MKKIILFLACGILLADQLYAQDGTINGSHFGDNKDVFIINWDNSSNADAGLRLATYRSGYKHWNIFNERENNNLHFSYSTSSSGGSIGTRRMTLTNGGYLGIGTTSPGNKLDVAGGIDINDYIRHNGDENTYFGFYGHDIFRIYTNGLDRFFVSSSGNIGVGNTAPAYKLDVTGDIRAINGWIRSQGDYGLYNNSDGTYIYSDDGNYWRTRSDRGITIANKANARKGVIYHDNANSFGLLDADAQWSVRFERDSNTRWYINNSQRMTLDNSGLSLTGNLKRTAHHTGHLEGSYNNVGENSTRSNPIYTIGSSYNPSSTSLGNMYGVGYTHKNASFINSTDLGMTPASNWGMYVAADGNARIFLDASQGNGYFKGNLHPYGHVYGRSANGSYSNLYRFGGLYLTWDSDSYGTNTHHSIRSTLGDTYGDDMTINTFDKLRINLDANNNNSDSYFEIGHNTTATSNAIFRVQEDGKTGIGTTSPDEKLSVIGKLSLANTADETIDYLRLYHDGQANLSTEEGALHFRKNTTEYLSLEDKSGATLLDASGRDMIFKAYSGGTGDLTIKNDGTVVIHNGFELEGNLNISNTELGNEDEYVLSLGTGNCNQPKKRRVAHPMGNQTSLPRCRYRRRTFLQPTCRRRDLYL